MKPSIHALLTAMSVLLSACGGGDDTVQGTPVSPAPPAPVAPAPPAPPGTEEVTIPPTGQTNTITSARITTCPDGLFFSTSAGTVAPNLQCMVGSAHGFVLPELKVPCTLTIASNGTRSLEADGQKAEMSLPFSSETFSKHASTGSMYLFAEQPGSMGFYIDAGGTEVQAGNIFTGNGGALAASFQRIPGVSSFSCLFDIR